MTWLQKLLRRKPNGKAPEVEEAEQVRDSQFGEWDGVLAEVDRVQKIANGEPRPSRRAHP